jgi:hypothetical protein
MGIGPAIIAIGIALLVTGIVLRFTWARHRPTPPDASPWH